MNEKFAENSFSKEKKIYLSGNGELSFITISGDIFEAYKILEKKLNAPHSDKFLIGPEIYGTSKCVSGGLNCLGKTCFRGTYPKELDIFCGIQACVASGVNTEEIVLDGEKVGAVFEDEFARYALLGGIFPDNFHSCGGAQTMRVFEKIEAILKNVGMDFSNVVRTWFYNNSILDWYDEFNRARDLFFDYRNIFESFVPASTGIGSKNIKNAALMARAFAVLPKSEKVQVKEIDSPMQCSALDYRSSFSRAAELLHPNFRYLLISGTAGIEQKGETAFVGNPVCQINLALDVIEAILKSREMDWSDALRAVAYFKDISIVPEFLKIAEKRELCGLPCIFVQADVCRDDLIFEMELDAAKNT